MKKQLLIFAMLACSAAAHGLTFNVDSTTDAPDANPGNGICATAAAQCTLRAAISEANSQPGADIVNVPAGTYILTAGALAIGGNVDISGAGTGSTIVNGNNVSAVLSMLSDAGPVYIRDLTVTGGNNTVSGGGGIFIAVGYAVELLRVAITGNAAGGGGSGQGGGIFVGGSLDMTDSTVSGNSGPGVGGGLRIGNGASAEIKRSTFSGNSSQADGGGIYVGSGATLSITNSTLSGNTSAGFGSGIANTGTANVRFSTLSANAGTAQLSNAGGALTVSGTIIALPTSGTNCAVAAGISGGNNLDSANNCGFNAAGDLVNTNPLLGPLGNNGGATQTQALLAGSPAIDAGPTTGAIPATDQREAGFSRVAGPRADIGAFEAAAVVPPNASVGPASLVEGNAGTSVLNFPVTLSAPAPAGSVSITYFTGNGTASGATDFAPVAGGVVVVIAAGATTGNLPVTINGDALVEADETFTVSIVSADATVVGAVATGTILNDDGIPAAGVTSVPVDNPFALAAAALLILGFALRSGSLTRRR